MGEEDASLILNTLSEDTDWGSMRGPLGFWRHETTGQQNVRLGDGDVQPPLSQRQGGQRGKRQSPSEKLEGFLCDFPYATLAVFGSFNILPLLNQIWKAT